MEEEGAKTKGLDGDGAEGEGGEVEGGEGVDDGATAVEKAEVSGSERQSPEERSEVSCDEAAQCAHITVISSCRPHPLAHPKLTVRKWAEWVW